MEGHLVMSRKERERLKVFARVKRKELTLKEAAELTELCYRHCRRAYQRYQEEGDKETRKTRKIIAALQISVDGFIKDPKQ